MVRDNALAVSGLLSPQIGGPSVKPYQPAGYWDFLNFPTREWVADHGENQYRRGLYTFWQRTFLHPSLLAFDASTREECTVERPRSNTPLQALVLLERSDLRRGRAGVRRADRSARAAAARAERLRCAFRQALRPRARGGGSRLLDRLLREASEAIPGRRQRRPEALLKVGDAKPPAGVEPAELAAWTSVARVILNLHETITRD